MKILFTSDWQCTLQNLHLCEETVEELLRQATKHKVDMVVHLGDVKESFNYYDQRISNFLVSSTQRIVKQFQYRILLGNHDRIGVDDSLPSCMPVLQSAGATVIDMPTMESIEGCSIAWIPYIRDEEALAKALEQVRGTYLFFHFEVKGAQWNQTSQAEGGVTPKALKPFHACIGGHIHLPQSMGNTHYVGSPFSCSWGEVNQEKRFLLLDTETGKLTSIPLSIRNYLDPVEKGFPKRKLTPRDTIRIKVRYSGHSNLPEVLRKAREGATRKYTPAAIHVVPVKEEVDTLSPRFETSGSDEELLTQYFEAQQAKQPGRLTAYLLHHLAGEAVVGPKAVEFHGVEARETLSYQEASMKYRPGLSLLTGQSTDWEDRSNGSGKSNSLALPTIALCGVNPKGQEHDGWRRDGATGPSSVTLDLTIGKRPWRILRGRHPVVLRAEVEGRNVLSGDARQAQHDLEELTGLTRDVLMNSLYIDQREVNLLLSGTEKQRKSLLSQFLGLERFDKALASVRQDILRTQRALELNRDEIAGTQHLLDVHKASLEQIPIAGDQEELRTKLAGKTEQLLTCQLRVQHLQPGEEVGWWSVLSDLLHSLTSERNTIDRDISVLRRELQRFDTLPGTCPTCRQPIQKGTLEKHKKELANQIQELEESCRLSRIVDGRVTRWLNGLERRNTTQDHLARVEEAKERQLAREVEVLTAELKSTETLDTLRRNHENGIRQWSRAQKLFQEYEGILLELLESQKETAAAVSRTGLPAFLVADSCPKLNDAAQFYSNLFAEGEIQVEFAITEDRTLDVHVVNLHGSRELRGQSEGETRMASLITSFSVRDVLARTNLLILDEPGDGLDSANAQAFAAALPKVVERFGCVVVTTHNPHIISGLEPDYRYLVTKENGVSVLKELGAGSV